MKPTNNETPEVANTADDVRVMAEFLRASAKPLPPEIAELAARVLDDEQRK